jgi:hypothetical protein
MGSLRESMTGETTMRKVVEKEIGEEVVVVAALSQGTPPSPLSMVTGAALIKLISPRASKALPKRFILAVTPDRVVASWNRGEVTTTRSPDGNGGVLQIPGASIPVFDRPLGNPRERELFMALGA